jgi:hypothetical protein
MCLILPVSVDLLAFQIRKSHPLNRNSLSHFILTSDNSRMPRLTQRTIAHINFLLSSETLQSRVIGSALNDLSQKTWDSLWPRRLLLSVSWLGNVSRDVDCVKWPNRFSWGEDSHFGREFELWKWFMKVPNQIAAWIRSTAISAFCENVKTIASPYD